MGWLVGGKLVAQAVQECGVDEDRSCLKANTRAALSHV
jgi:hypothetical protein